MDPKSSKRILELAKRQQEEELLIDERGAESSDGGARPRQQVKEKEAKRGAIAQAIRSHSNDDNDEEEEDEVDTADRFLDEEYQGELVRSY